MEDQVYRYSSPVGGSFVVRRIGDKVVLRVRSFGNHEVNCVMSDWQWADALHFLGKEAGIIPFPTGDED